jgi:hypothetical protein
LSGPIDLTTVKEGVIITLPNTTDIAQFFDSDLTDTPAAFTATIDCGDGVTTPGTVVGSNGSFTVEGGHGYADEMTAPLTVVLTRTADGATATASGNVAVTEAGLTLANAGTLTENPVNNAVLTTLISMNPLDSASDFTASIDWGDGAAPTSGTVVGSGGAFTVEGGHTYADEGNDQARVVLTRTTDGATATASGSVAVGENDSLTFNPAIQIPQIFTVHTHQPFGPVFDFSDSDTLSPASDFTATIDWGDGTTTSGGVGLGSGLFRVSGSHAYALPGRYTMQVTLADDAPGTASATATQSVLVNGTAPFDVFGDGGSDFVFQNQAANASPGALVIDRWNGFTVISTNTFPQVDLSWHVVTSRDLNGDGKADLIWQNTNGTPGVWLMNGGPTAQVALTNPGPSWHLVASGDTNADANSDLIWQNTDGTLGVWLMNGTTPTAQVGLANPGANWKVVGTADYNGDARDDILLQNTVNGDLMIDLMNGTSISSTKTISVGDPSWHAVSTGVFNGQAEIAWQNTNGQVGVWLMNGTTPAIEAGLETRERDGNSSRSITSRRMGRATCCFRTAPTMIWACGR